MEQSLLQSIFNDSTVLQTIAEAAAESPEQPWSVMEIHENVADALDIDLDLDDTELFAELLKFYNGKQAEFAANP